MGDGMSVFKDGYTYLASPYSHNDPAIKEMRAATAKRVTAQLLNEGQLIYSPIASCHDMASEYAVPTDWQFWSRYDRVMIASAVRFIVLKLDGWETSVGVQAEIEIAKGFGLEIEYMEVPKAV